MEPSLIISGISSIVACIALMVSISSNRKANKAEQSEVVVNLRIEVLQLQTTIEFFHKKYSEKLDQYPPELASEIELNPDDMLATLQEIEEVLASAGFKAQDELDSLRVSVGKIKKQWQYAEKNYLGSESS